jgi:hypothetical protein
MLSTRIRAVNGILSAMKKINISRKSIFLILVTIIAATHWFFDIKNINFDTDEAYYILSSQFYFHRKNNNLDAFTLPSDYNNLSWSSLQNQLIDQPQLGKYIIGFILESTNRNPWKNSDLSWLYNEFARLKLPSGKKLHQINDYLGTEMINAIATVRYASAFAGLLSLSLLAYATTRITNNPLIGTFVFIFSSFHPLLRQYLRIATTNSFSLLFLLSNILLIYAVLKTSKKISLHNLFLSALLLGTINAASASIKINGLFPLSFPFALIIISLLSNKVKLASIKQYLTRPAIIISGTIMGFVSTFLYLEPELWNNPIKGMVSLIGVRLAQQQRFFAYFGKFSLPEVIYTLFDLFLSVSDQNLIKTLMILVLLIGLNELRKKSEKEKNTQIILYLLTFSLITNAFYARVKSFDRYLIPSVLIIIFIASMGINKFIPNQSYKPHKPNSS